jgi:hypothetical protein
VSNAVNGTPTDPPPACKTVLEELLVADVDPRELVAVTVTVIVSPSSLVISA